jgi:hypothetical protein
MSMQKSHFTVCQFKGLWMLHCAASCILLSEGPALPDMRSDFTNPPIVDKPRPLWFWTGAIDSAGVADELQKYRDSCGYGGVAIMPDGWELWPKYLSEDYFKVYGVAVKKAQELGMKLCIYRSEERRVGKEC